MRWVEILRATKRISCQVKNKRKQTNKKLNEKNNQENVQYRYLNIRYFNRQDFRLSMPSTFFQALQHTMFIHYDLQLRLIWVQWQTDKSIRINWKWKELSVLRRRHKDCSWQQHQWSIIYCLTKFSWLCIRCISHNTWHWHDLLLTDIRKVFWLLQM